MVEITIRDGRIGRNPAQDTPEGGPILATVERAEPLEVGQRVNLPDGAIVKIIGTKDDILPGQSWRQTVFIGNVP